MTSSIELANQALTLLGATRIVAFSDGSNNASAMSTLYPQVKRSVLRGYAWNCASRRKSLAQHADAPLTGEFKFSYAAPDNALRILNIWSAGSSGSHYNFEGRKSSDDDWQWSLEGKSLLTDANPAIAIYIEDIDEGQLDAHVADAIMQQLAARAAYGITGSNTVLGAMVQLAAGTLEEARTTDALEKTTKPLVAERFQNVRY